MDNIAAVEHELLALRRRISLLQRLLVLLVTGAFAVVVLTAQSHDQTILSTQELRLTDTSGAVRARLTLRDAGARLEFYDAEGRVRNVVGVMSDGPGLWLEPGNPERTSGIVSTTNGPSLFLNGSAGNSLQANILGGRPALQLTGAQAIVQLADRPDSARVEMKLDPSVGPTFRLLPGFMAVSSSLGPALYLRGTSGQDQLLLTVDAGKQKPFMMMTDGSGRTVASIP